MLIIYFNDFIYISLFQLFNKIFKKKLIFSFWEPKNKMPGYLHLCIKTWQKFLPEYQFRILDYKSAQIYLGKSLLSIILCENMSLPIQVDAIRVALLNKYGGIWMDADTIVLNRDIFNKIKDFDLILFGDEKTKTQNIGFIYASDKSIIINEWLKEIIKNVKIYKKIMTKRKTNIIHENDLMKLRVWNYLGNGIVDKLITKNITGKNFLRLDRNKLNIFPEFQVFKNYSWNIIDKYRKLYFQEGDHKIILKYSKSIIMLHNSWTPIKYKFMSENDFLKQDIVLSKLLNHIINEI